VTTNRLEAFSDGVFAIAITLLVLELHVPTEDHLWSELKDEWPSFAAFLLSFWVIGIIWVNHHGVIDHIGRANRPLLYLNLLLLLTVVFIPFPLPYSPSISSRVRTSRWPRSSTAQPSWRCP